MEVWETATKLPRILKGNGPAAIPKRPMGGLRVERKYQRHRRWLYTVFHYIISQAQCDGGLRRIIRGRDHENQMVVQGM